MKNTGYREMLRDRCPKIVGYALKWCKAKESWLDHVYKNFIWIYSDSNERLKATYSILGYDEKHKNRKFNFADTISYDNLSEEEKSKWKNITSWVSWFQKQYAYIKNSYCISKQKSSNIEQIKLDIISTYLKSMCPTKEDDAKVREQKNKNVNALADFLIDCFENRI